MEPLLDIKNLSMEFIADGTHTQALDRINFSVKPGEIVCIVGESGCGKSVTALSIMGLLAKNAHITEGSIVFDGLDLLHLNAAQRSQIRGNTLSMIFQDAMTSLNPVFTIGKQLTEAICLHHNVSKKEAQAIAVQKLEQVGLPQPQVLMKKHPFALSGGMRQRVMIAMALCGNSKLLIADEPTTALDVTIQAQIVQLIKKLRKELNLSVILITHDIGLVAEMADRVLVMYAGQIVEQADVFELFHNPSHPYTYALLQSVPHISMGNQRRLSSIGGRVPEHYEAIQGCRFFDRCPFALPECQNPQAMHQSAPEHLARCMRSGSDWAELERQKPDSILPVKKEVPRYASGE